MNDYRHDSESKEQQVTDAIEISVKSLFAAGVIIAGIGILIFAWQQQVTTRSKADTSLLGDLGSFFSGTVGVIWSLASVILFYLALKEQRKDIKINQHALNLQINELEETRHVYVEQSEIFRIQTFENTFFQLLQIYSSTVRDSHWNPGFGQGQSTGKNIFIVWKQRLDEISYGQLDEASIQDEYGFYKHGDYTKFEDTDDDRKAFGNAYIKEYKSFEDVLSQYFRQLYHIFKYIHLSRLISEERKPFYASLVRAQLSQSELCALVFNSLITNHGNPKFLFLIKEYQLIKNLDRSNISEPFIWSFFDNEIEKVSDPFK